MNPTVMQAVLWIVAGLFLTLLIIRRGKRKARAASAVSGRRLDWRTVHRPTAFPRERRG